MQSDTMWNSAFSWLVGSTVGSGMAVFFILATLLGMLGVLGGYLTGAIYYIDERIQDHTPESLPEAENDTTLVPS